MTATTDSDHPHPPGPAPRRRLTAIDRLRGLVMVLMTIDHADAPLNAGHYAANSAHFAFMGADPGPASFATRTLTHLCAPTFLFLAGVSVVLSAASARRRGETEPAIDRHLSLRGLVLVLLDPLVMTFAFGLWFFVGGHKPFLLQVLYAIGVALLLSPLLRRLPSVVLVLGALALMAATEWVLPGRVMQVPPWPPENGPLWSSLLFTGGWHFGLVREFGLMIMYPCLPWLAPMMLGIAFGRVLERRGTHAARTVAFAGGLVSLLAFLVVRGLNGWGNTLMARDDASLMEWLDVSKYPPGVAYLTLTLGVMGLVLGGLLWLDASRGGRDTPARVRDPLSVLGKTALLYYLLHIPLLVGAGAVGAALTREPGSPISATPPFGVWATWIAWPLCVLLLYPGCAWYGRYKGTHRNVVTRYL